MGSNRIKPQRQAADSTRNTILKVAQRLFAKKGFAGTSISAIAKQAKINPSLIYHHFGDKKDLWKLAKTGLLTVYAKSNELKSFDNLTSPNSNFASFLYQVIKWRFDFYDKNPNIVRMISWQRLEPDKKELQYNCCAPQEKWLATLQSFQERGEIYADIHPEVALVMILNGVMGFFMDYYAGFAAAHNKPEIKKTYLTMICKTIYRALSNKPNPFEQEHTCVHNCDPNNDPL